MNDRTVATKEIKITLTFKMPVEFYNWKNKEQYTKAIDNWINTWIMKPLNGGYPSSDLAPMMAYVKAEDITD